MDRSGGDPRVWRRPVVVAAAAIIIVLVLGVVAGLVVRNRSAQATGADAPSATATRSASESESAMGTPSPSPTPTSTPTPSPTPTPPRDLPSLVGETRNAWAFVPLDDPTKVIVEGSVPTQRAWSTSKVLVTAAFLQVVAGGDPTTLNAEQERIITKALTESDGNSIIWLHDAVPGGSGPTVNAILQSIGDNQTFYPNSAMNDSTWTLENQLTFLVALHQGRVVNPAVSAYLISKMRPVESESWGLGTVGSTAFKGGWVSQWTETRQMGYLHGYAVAIITVEGNAVLQIDGDSAFVDQMNHLAALLDERLRP